MGKRRTSSPPGTVESREQKFVEGICRGMGKRKAALYAGFAASSANKQAHLLMERDHVRDAIDAYVRRDELEMLAAREVLRKRLFAMACADPLDSMTDDFELLPKSDIPKAVRRMIVSVRTWDSPEQGKGSSARFLSPETAIRTYLKLFPSPPPRGENLSDAVAAVEQDMDALIARIESESAKD